MADETIGNPENRKPTDWWALGMNLDKMSPQMIELLRKRMEECERQIIESKFMERAFGL